MKIAIVNHKQGWRNATSSSFERAEVDEYGANAAVPCFMEACTVPVHVMLAECCRPGLCEIQQDGFGFLCVMVHILSSIHANTVDTARPVFKPSKSGASLHDGWILSSFA